MITARRKKTKHNIIALPGEKSPEHLIFDYYDELAKEQDSKGCQSQTFWDTDTALDKGLTKHRYLTSIKPQISGIEENINQLREEKNLRQGREGNYG